MIRLLGRARCFSWEPHWRASRGETGREATIDFAIENHKVVAVTECSVHFQAAKAEPPGKSSGRKMCFGRGHLQCVVRKI